MVQLFLANQNIGLKACPENNFQVIKRSLFLDHCVATRISKRRFLFSNKNMGLCRVPCDQF